MECEVLFLHSLEPATCPYPEPHQSTTCLPSHCWKINLVLSFHLCMCLPSVLFLLCFPTKTLHASLLSPISALCSTQLILLYLITKFLVSSTDHKAPHCAVFSTPLLSRTLGPNIFLSTLFSNTLSLCSSLIVRHQLLHPTKQQAKL